MATAHRTPRRTRLVFLAGSSGEAIRKLLAAVSDPSEWSAVGREPIDQYTDRYTFELAAVASLGGLIANTATVAAAWLLLS